MILLPAVLAFFLCFALLCVLLSRPAMRLALDRPNERSLHRTPVPRTGGLAIMAGVSTSLLFADGDSRVLVLIALGLALVSFADDMRGMPVRLRLAVHLGAAAACLFALFPNPDPLLFPLLLIGIAWLANLYNFMDGSDGLAGGMAAIGFGACAYAAQAEGAGSLAVACASIAASAVAFLLFNFNPARIFMGDSGSIPLGFLAGALGVAGWRDAVWPLWFPLLVFGPFVADATYTLLRRAARRERLSQAHREHYYQRLVRMGLGHRRTALWEYAAMVTCSALALWARTASLPVQAMVVVGALLLSLPLAAWIDHLWLSRGERNT